MTRLLLDVNIVLDVVLERAPFYQPASTLWAKAEKHQLELLVPAHGVTTVFYFAARERDRGVARRVVSDLLLVLGVAAVDEAVLRRALALAWPDFEDAVCAAAAEASGCDALVTRDPKGYPDSPVLVLDAATALSLVDRGKGPGEVAEKPASAYEPRKRRRRP